jgi:saccharopine dehydrogenase-like NADP-dependent oxidoreductase
LLERFPTPEQEPDDCEVVRVDVRGKAAGADKLVRMETTVLADKRWKLSCGALDTGVPPSIVAQMIMNNQINQTGVLAPEVCVPAQPLFDELAKRKIVMRQEVISQEPAAARAR